MAKRNTSFLQYNSKNKGTKSINGFHPQRLVRNVVPLKKCRDPNVRINVFVDKALIEITILQTGDLSKIELLRVGPDSRKELRKRNYILEEELTKLKKQLGRLDKYSSLGPWTSKFIDLIKKHPSLRSEELAIKIGWEKEKLKVNVRKLKNLGLTISLGTG